VKLFPNKRKALGISLPDDGEKKQTRDREKKQFNGLFIKLSFPFVVSSALVPFLVSLAIVGLFISPALTERANTLTTAYANHYATFFEQKLQGLTALGHSIANRSDVLEVLTVPEGVSALEARLQAHFPDILSIDLLMDDALTPNKEKVPPVNFAAIDLVKRAMRRKEVPAEAHKIENQWVLRLATPVGGNEQGARAVILMNVDFKAILKGLPAAMPNMNSSMGWVRLDQQFSTPKVDRIWQQGDSRWKESETVHSVPIANNALWTLHFHASSTLEKGTFDRHGFFLLVGMMVFVGVVLALISHILLTRTLSKDHKTFFEFMAQLMTKGASPQPKYRLNLYATMSSVLAERINDARTRLITQAADTSSAIETAVVDNRVNNTPLTEHKADESTADPLFQNQDIFDIDMNEEDENILNVTTTNESTSMPTATVPTATVKVPESIFRAYDIRGIVGDTLTKDIVYRIGQAIGSEALAQGESTVAVARDGRISGPELIERLINGLTSTGCHVINIGMVPTPVLYYATNTLDTRSGVMLTGSHNPSDYNGLKIVINGNTLSGDAIQHLKQRIIDNRLEKGVGNVEEVNIQESYVERIVGDVVLARPMKVIVDCGNGVPGAVAPGLLTALGCEVTSLFCEVDGEFPNHHPDPSKPDNLQDLIRTVQSEGADLGLAFDGDGDRIGVVTPKGKIIFSDRLLMLYASDLLSRNPGADIIFDVKCTRDLADLIASQGGRAIMWKTGHSFIKAKLKETGAVLAGEMSGHIFFNDRWYGFDDALYSAARLLEILSMETSNADEIFSGFPENVSTPEINIPVTEDSKFKIVDSLQRFGDFGEGKVITIDGVRVDYPDCWGLVRASNTTPVLVARFEADNEEALEKIKALFRNNLLNVDSGLAISF
jgi:phosphomannomutase/phosphoglucomutase